MDNAQTLRSMVRDDAYEVVRVMSDSPSGRTELVTLDGEGPLVRKSIPLELANPGAWGAAMGIDDPLLPKVESLYRLPDMLVVVYEFVQGEPLSMLVERGATFSERQVANLACDVCHAASCLHAVGVLHRDITPSNVIVGDGRAHLIDLGIARQQKRDAHHDTTALGTWGFAAPEQFGFVQTDVRSDIYSIGRLIGHLLTGVSPSSPDFERELAHVAGAKGVRGNLAAVAARASSFEPSLRYQSADQLSAAIQSAVTMGADFDIDATIVSTDISGYGYGVTSEVTRDTSRRRAQTDETSEEKPSQKLAKYINGSRRSSDTPMLLRLIDLIVIVSSIIFLVVLVWVLSGPPANGDPSWTPLGYAVALALTSGAAGLSLETHRAVSLWGPYEHAPRKLLVFLKRMSIFVAIVTSVLLAASFLFPEV